jgi:hypothetical protein
VRFDQQQGEQQQWLARYKAIQGQTVLPLVMGPEMQLSPISRV